MIMQNIDLFSSQDVAHPHQVALYKNSIYIPDLGADRVYHYVVDAATKAIAFHDYYAVEAGSGPRHMTFDAARSRAYLLNELKQTISVFSVG